MSTFTLIGGDLDEAEAAAAMAAIACLLDEEAAVPGPAGEARQAGWSNAAKLIAQGLIPTRVPATPRWSSIERLRRAGKGGSGIVGQ